MMFVILQTAEAHVARSKYLDCPVGSLYGKWCAVGYSHYANEHYNLVVTHKVKEKGGSCGI